MTERDQAADSEGSAEEITTAQITTSDYKVLGERDAKDGIGVLGRNTATTGEANGVRGETDSPLGFGLYTPDDAGIEGVLDTAETDFVVEAGTIATGVARNVVQGHAVNAVNDGAVGATIGGGGYDNGTTVEPNQVSDDYCTISGGRNNTAGDNDNDSTTAQYATVGGGQKNLAKGEKSTIGGGAINSATAKATTVGGGAWNKANKTFATIAGGGPSDTGNASSTNNVVYDEYGTIGGGGNNQAGADDSFPARQNYATVGGGKNNKAKGSGATIGGGKNNDVLNDEGTIAGGVDNQAGKSGTTNSEAFVGGGRTNLAKATQSAIVCGSSNEILDGALQAVIGGGRRNYASGSRATIPGGRNNQATGNYSYAAGRGAEANNAGAYVWADDQDGTAVKSDVKEATSDPTGSNTWTARAYGGVRFITGSGKVTYIPSGSTGWNNSSSRSVKTNVDPVDPGAVLAGVESMEVATWEYEEDGEGEGIRHIGPMAEDFHDAVDEDLGNSDEHINTINADGVALAAIQGLSAELDDAREDIEVKDERIDDLEAEAEELREENEQLRGRLAAVEDRLGIDAPDGTAPADD